MSDKQMTDDGQAAVALVRACHHRDPAAFDELIAAAKTGGRLGQVAAFLAGAVDQLGARAFDDEWPEVLAAWEPDVGGSGPLDS